MPTEAWLRPEYKGQEDKLNTVSEFADRQKVSLLVVRSLFARYADQIPEPVKEVNGRLKYFVTEELDIFYTKVRDRDRQRTPLEVAQSEVVRIETVLKSTEERVDKRRKELAKAEADLRKFKEKLKAARERVDLERMAIRSE